MNEGMEGGETSFPRWLNGETTDVLQVKPEVGKAVLFYNVLPDGNYDERSQHAAKPVLKGEKWLTNLWVWVSTTNEFNSSFGQCSSVFVSDFITSCALQDPYMF